MSPRRSQRNRAFQQRHSGDFQTENKAGKWANNQEGNMCYNELTKTPVGTNKVTLFEDILLISLDNLPT